MAKLFDARIQQGRGDARNDISYWGILGDNLYDQNGNITTQFFDSLSDAVKNKITLTSPGNHDYWVAGSPAEATSIDQYGNGFAQFYAMDTRASESSDETGSSSTRRSARASTCRTPS